MVSQLRDWQQQKAATVSRLEEQREKVGPLEVGTTEAGLTEVTWPLLEILPEEEKVRQRLTSLLL